MTVESSGPAGDMTQIFLPLLSTGLVGTLGISISDGPEASVELLPGLRSIGKAGAVTAEGNTDEGWVLVTDRASVWRKMHDFTYPDRNPLGGIDFTIAVSKVGTWRVSTNPSESGVISSEASIANDPLLEGRP